MDLYGHHPCRRESNGGSVTNTAYSHLAGREVDTWSEDWRHETECRWLLTAKPSRTEKHLWLFGVRDRAKIIDPNTGALREDWRVIAERKTSITQARGLRSADRILADARRLHEISQANA